MNGERYFDKLRPWIIKVLTTFKIGDLDKTDFGPGYCQVFQESNIPYSGNAVVKTITDGKTLITAIFTLDSIKQFYERSSSRVIWENKILMLEKFKLTHVADFSGCGEISLKVEKFCSIGDPTYMPNEYPITLYWATADPVIKKRYQEIWDNKLLDEVQETFDFTNDTAFDNNFITPDSSMLFPSDIKSMSNFLVISSEEQKILDSLPGWNSGKNDRKSKPTKYTKKINTKKGIQNNKSSGVIEDTEICVIGVKNVTKTQGNENNCNGFKDVNSIDLKKTGNCMKNSNMECKKASSSSSSSKNKNTVAHSNEKTCILNKNKQNQCAYALIKQNVENEERRLSHLRSTNTSEDVCVTLNLSCEDDTPPLEIIESYKSSLFNTKAEKRQIEKKDIPNKCVSSAKSSETNDSYSILRKNLINYRVPRRSAKINCSNSNRSENKDVVNSLTKASCKDYTNSSSVTQLCKDNINPFTTQYSTPSNNFGNFKGQKSDNKKSIFELSNEKLHIYPDQNSLQKISGQENKPNSKLNNSPDDKLRSPKKNSKHKRLCSIISRKLDKNGDVSSEAPKTESWKVISTSVHKKKRKKSIEGCLKKRKSENFTSEDSNKTNSDETSDEHQVRNESASSDSTSVNNRITIKDIQWSFTAQSIHTMWEMIRLLYSNNTNIS